MLALQLFIYTIICLLAYNYSPKRKVYNFLYEDIIMDIFMIALVTGNIIILSYNIYKIKSKSQRPLIFSDIIPVLYHFVFYICIVGLVLFIADSF